MAGGSRVFHKWSNEILASTSSMGYSDIQCKEVEKMIEKGSYGFA
jgi:hypothetical protein